MSSAYSKQETNLPMRSRGSQSFPKLSAKSLIYKEKREAQNTALFYTNTRFKGVCQTI
jgi:hypothetical protein